MSFNQSLCKSHISLGKVSVNSLFCSREGTQLITGRCPNSPTSSTSDHI